MAYSWASVDESADRARKHVFVVAGLTSTNEIWFDIERFWDRRLKKEGMNYFKHSQYLGLRGQFKKFSDGVSYPRPTGRNCAREVIEDLCLILRSSTLVGLAIGIDLKDYKSIRRSSRVRSILPADPYRFAYQMMIVFLASSISRTQNPAPIAFLCDTHDKFKLLESSYESLKEKNPLCGKWMASLTSKKDEKSPAIQAADMVAGITKANLVERTKPNADIPALNKRLRSELGSSVSVLQIRKGTLQAIVDANLLKDGRPNIRSGRQLQLFHDTLQKLMD